MDITIIIITIQVPLQKILVTEVEVIVEVVEKKVQTLQMITLWGTCIVSTNQQSIANNIV